MSKSKVYKIVEESTGHFYAYVKCWWGWRSINPTDYCIDGAAFIPAYTSLKEAKDMVEEHRYKNSKAQRRTWYV